MVKAVGLVAGLRNVRVEFAVEVVIIVVPVIYDVLVERPNTA
jgi:hypothetical protein